MSDKYYYKIYGLIVVSEIYIQEAATCDVCEKPDVEIVIGEIPEFLRGSKEKGYGTWTNDFENAWFNTPGAAQYYVEHGKKIVVEPEENPNTDLLCSLILSAGMCLILLQRNEPVMHGSAIVVKDGAVVICGESGAGKSTVTMELLQQKVGFLADDTVRVRIDNGKVIAEPSYPQQKICRDQIKKYNLNVEELRYIDEDRDKFALSRKDIFVDSAKPLKTMVVLKKQAGIKQVYSRQLKGKEALEALIDNLYLSTTYKHIVGVPVQLMQQFITIASSVGLYEVYRPEEGDSVQSILNELKKILQVC